MANVVGDRLLVWDTAPAASPFGLAKVQQIRVKAALTAPGGTDTVLTSGGVAFLAEDVLAGEEVILRYPEGKWMRTLACSSIGTGVKVYIDLL